METMNLSIIIPVYNINEYLQETIENTLTQNYQDFEIILVDDGSNDQSAELCDYFANADSRVVVIHKENEGVSSARNIGVARAKGKYIGFVDSDDLIEPNMFETLVSIAEKENADIVQCRHNREEKIANKRISCNQRIINGETFVKELFDYSGGEYTNQVALWSKIYRRELFEGITFPVGRTYEDEQETYKLCLKADKIVLISDELYHYVKRENSIITGISAKKMIDKQLALLDRIQYLPNRVPELEEKCVLSFCNYSENIMCQLYELGCNNELQMSIDNLLLLKRQLLPWLSGYRKVYYNLINIRLFRSWILNNQFEPIQKLIVKIKRK